MGSLLVLGMFACGGPQGYVIQGEITGLPDSTKLLLYHSESGTIMDSAWAVGGRFQMKGFFE